MSHWQRIAVLILCSQFCVKQFYLGGFETSSDKENCYCFERLPITTPYPLPITLSLPALDEYRYPWENDE